MSNYFWPFIFPEMVPSEMDGDIEVTKNDFVVKLNET